MEGMTLAVKTEHLQLLMMGIMFAEKELRCVMTKEDQEEIETVLAEMNKMCSADNNYTLTVEVYA